MTKEKFSIRGFKVARDFKVATVDGIEIISLTCNGILYHKSEAFILISYTANQRLSTLQWCSGGETG